MARRRKKIAIIYDFDGTLSPGNMQEYDFFPKLNVKPKDFWAAVKKRAKDNNADEILSYMTLMLERATSESGVCIKKESFKTYGKGVSLFCGVDTWFSRINKYAKKMNLNPQHFILSSGIKEMVEGTTIAENFEEIFASSFIYDQHDIAISPGVAINYTTKTQFLFRINKGVLNVWDNAKINEFVEKKERDIPFEHMIYIGDGLTDVPCMKLVKELGGHSIAVYAPRKRNAKEKAMKLMMNERVSLVAPADYSEGKLLEQQIKAIIEKIHADLELERFQEESMK